MRMNVHHAPRRGGETISGEMIVGIVGAPMHEQFGRTVDMSSALGGPSRGSERTVSQPASCFGPAALVASAGASL